MLRKVAAVVSVLMLAACSPSGRLENPFAKKPPFVPTPVPADFAIVVDENHDTFYAHQHIQQVITAADAMSRTTYATYRDYSGTVSRRYSQETPLNPQQLQAMWNEIQKNELMLGSTPWINWRSDADMYKRNVYTVQILANGQTKSFRETNGFPAQVRPLMVHIQAVRLPVGQNVRVPVVGGEPQDVGPGEPGPAVPMPIPIPAETAPATSPATQPDQ
jgi:hypothetical protein